LNEGQQRGDRDGLSEQEHQRPSQQVDARLGDLGGGSSYLCGAPDLGDDDAIVVVPCQTGMREAVNATVSTGGATAAGYNPRRPMRITPAGNALAAVAMACAAAFACSRPARLAADLVITGANIWTGNPLQPDARAVAIIGDRIVDVGGADEIDRWRGASTTVIDAEGRRVVPDLVILSEDVFSIPPARIKEVSVLTTVVGGKVVHQRNP
jgi:hypothetical protein